MQARVSPHTGWSLCVVARCWGGRRATKRNARACIIYLKFLGCVAPEKSVCNAGGFAEEESDDGVIGVRDEGGQGILTTAWAQSHHLQANKKPTFRCVHSNPWVGEIESGGSREVRGCVLLHQTDSIDEAFGRTVQTIGNLH